MAKSYNQKAKILYLERMMQKTGEDRAMTMQQILEELLGEFGVEINEKVPILKENGGFIFSSDHSIPNSVSLENMKLIMDTVKQVGKY